MITKDKENIPSQFSVWLSPDYIIALKFINLSNKKCCGRAENRTRNCWVTTTRFATKLFAHNDSNTISNYLNANCNL